MRLGLLTAPALVPYLPALALEHIRRPDVGGRKHAQDRQHALCWMLDAGFGRFRRHRHAPGATYFPSRGVDAWLHTGRDPAKARALLAPFYDYAEGRTDYHAGRREAKPFHLKAEPAAALSAVHGGDVALDAYAELDGGERVAFDRLPTCGVPAEVAEVFPMPRVLSLPMATVDRALATVAEWAAVEGWHAPADPTKAGGLTLEDVWHMLRLVRSWVRSVGGVPNVYRLERSGRLGGVDLSPVSMPRIVRALLLGGGPLRDYDLNASNWRVYHSAARACGLRVPVAEAYLSDRAAHHRRWSAATGHAEGAVKAVPLSWLTGATLSANAECAAVRAMGAESFRHLTAVPFIRQLYAETRATLPRILAELMPGTRDGNAGGAERWPDDGADDLTPRQQAAHFLAGAEQFAMRAVGPHVKGLAALVYDGAIASEQDTTTWAGLVRERSAAVLGFPLDVQFVCKPFTLPERG